MGDTHPFIKREPDASHPTVSPPTLIPTTSVAKRDHLRALLDRARSRTAPHALVKRDDHPTPAPSSSVQPPSAVATIPAQRGLLPTPNAALLLRREPLQAHATTYDTTHHYDAAPIPSLHPTAMIPALAHGAPVATASYAYTPDYETYHYEAPPPPRVTIPPPPTYPPVDHAAIDQALVLHSATISPSSATTTSSSSSNTKRRKPSPLEPFPIKATKQLPTPEPQDIERRMAVPKLSPEAIASLASLEDYEDNELHSDFSHTVHMLIPEGSFGCLVGNRGEFIKEINAASECTLSVRDGSSFPMFESDRVLRIYGKPKGICLAQHIVIARIRNYRAHKGDSNYLDLGRKPMAPMTKTSVTRAVTQAIQAECGDNDVDAAAEQGVLHWNIPKDAVGRIMGQRGNIQKAIARDTNTTIHIVPLQQMGPGSTERTVIITGEPADVKRARAMIEAKAGGRLEDDGIGAGKSGQYVVIPQHVAGFLIGPNGTRIRKIREETGARIQIAAQHDLPLGYVNRVLHIQGNNDQMEKAHAALLRRLQSYIGSSDVKLAAQEDEIALQLVLPTRICSFLLDQRGRLIREISEKAGAHARFLPPIDDDNRICVLYGNMPKVFRAERLVLQFIAGDAIANKWASAGGAPPRKRKRVIDDDDEMEYADDFEEDDTEMTDSRGRVRKRQQIEDSGRIVVHVSAPPRHSSSQSANRRPHAAHRKPQTKSNGRSKRRR